MKATEQELTDLANFLCKKYGYRERVFVVYNPRLWRKIAVTSRENRCIEFSTRWAMCNTKWFIIRVLKHEIVHLRYMSHGKAFNKECARLGIKGTAYIYGGVTPPRTATAMVRKRVVS